MPDLSEPTEAEGGRAKKVTLSVKEQKLIEAYRQKTACDRAFNDGLDHALEVVNASETTDTQAIMQVLREGIVAAHRDV